MMYYLNHFTVNSVSVYYLIHRLFTKTGKFPGECKVEKSNSSYYVLILAINQTAFFKTNYIKHIKIPLLKR